MRNQDRNYSIKCYAASFMATYISGVVHPLDLLKTRFQSHDGRANCQNLVPKYDGVVKGLKQIHSSEGVRGLYKGFFVSLFTQAIATSFFFWIYQMRKKHYQDHMYQTMNAVTCASIQASLIATLITQPIWVLKTRMLLNVAPGISELQNAGEKLREIYRQNGAKGFLKGINLSILLSFSGVLQMYVYEGSKLIYDKMGIPQSKFEEKNFICGSISKLTSVIVTYPITTVRTRIQQNQYIKDRMEAKYRSSSQIVLQLTREEGLRGFYKGLAANMMKGIPQRGIYFYFYELFKGSLIKQTS